MEEIHTEPQQYTRMMKTMSTMKFLEEVSNIERS